MAAIAVERLESEAGAGAVDELLGALDREHGAWLGCDVAEEGLYRRESMGCVRPALGFSVEGGMLRVLAFSPAGHALLDHVQTLAAFDRTEGELTGRFAGGNTAPNAVVTVLRAFLALFSPAYSELALYGALSFDYYRLAGGGGPPDDGQHRMMLYFPERVLVTKESESRWVEFRFPGLRPTGTGRSASIPPRRLTNEGDDLPPGGHAQRVARGIERLSRGDVYSLVLSQTFRRRISVRPSEAFRTLRALNPYPAMFFVNLGGGERLLGASPDLQVRADSEFVESAPVCGTVRRGADPIADAEQAMALLGSGKEDASLAICADSDRNDKAGVCESGSVELVTHRRIRFFSTIIHAIAHTRGRRRSDVDALDILLAHSTPATVTGVPKQAAIKVIGELEQTPRGWYAGVVVRLATDGSMEAMTVLRAARVVGDIAEVRTGGNLLVDSDPQKEEDETRLKAEAMFRVLSGASPKPTVATRKYEAIYGAELLVAGDPMGNMLSDCLASVGCAGVPGGRGTIGIVSDRSEDIPKDWLDGARPWLGIGEGGLALLESLGARLTSLPEPRYARRLKAEAQVGGFAASLESVEMGVYSRQVIERNNLPPGWKAVLVSTEGWILAAQSEHLAQAVILARPDSVQSIRDDAGRRILRAALDWLAMRAAIQKV
jgi:anthranilate synthase